uniref:Uncharacterized protein n=1 Tax=Arundo donax TaxID=35708 RepID=A0A0A9AT10_ARUDO
MPPHQLLLRAQTVTSLHRRSPSSNPSAPPLWLPRQHLAAC